MIIPQNDGVDHINIYSKGKTQLGRMLSNFHKHEVTTTHGDFLSVESYWYYLSLPEVAERELLKQTYGYKAKEIGKRLIEKHGKSYVDNFELLIMKAIQQKCLDNSHMFTSKQGKLPFEHYYTYGDKTVDVKDKYIWLIEGIDKIRNYIIKRIDGYETTNS